MFLCNQEVVAIYCLSALLITIYLNPRIQPPPRQEYSEAVISYVRLKQWLHSPDCSQLIITYDTI